MGKRGRLTVESGRKECAEAPAAFAAADSSPSFPPAGSPDAETPSSEVHTDTHATEDLVISPVVESVPRTSEEPAETKTGAEKVTNSQEALHDNQHPA